MKKVITTIALCTLLTTVFAQKKFNTIMFSKYYTTTGSPGMLDYGVFAKKGAASNLKMTETIKSGTIDINIIDSIITIKTEGDTDKIFKMKNINEEEKDKYKTKRLSISCINKAGNQFNLKIIRDETLKRINQMQVTINQNNDDGDMYISTYLEDLYQN